MYKKINLPSDSQVEVFKFLKYSELYSKIFICRRWADVAEKYCSVLPCKLFRKLSIKNSHSYFEELGRSTEITGIAKNYHDELQRIQEEISELNINQLKEIPLFQLLHVDPEQQFNVAEILDNHALLDCDHEKIIRGFRFAVVVNRDDLRSNVRIEFPMFIENEDQLTIVLFWLKSFTQIGFESIDANTAFFNPKFLQSAFPNLRLQFTCRTLELSGVCDSIVRDSDFTAFLSQYGRHFPRLKSLVFKHLTYSEEVKKFVFHRSANSCQEFYILYCKWPAEFFNELIQYVGTGKPSLMAPSCSFNDTPDWHNTFEWEWPDLRSANFQEFRDGSKRGVKKWAGYNLTNLLDKKIAFKILIGFKNGCLNRKMCIFKIERKN